MSTCRSCDICHICGRYYIMRQGVVCKWIDPDNNDHYGFDDCTMVSCPFCKYCCIDHCDSDSRLIKALNIRKKEYIRSINDISKRLNRRKREYVRTIDNIVKNKKECVVNEEVPLEFKPVEIFS